MIELVLKSLIVFLLLGILFALCKIASFVLHSYFFPLWHEKNEKKKQIKNISENIVKRAEKSLTRINNGEVKLEGLGNEANPHDGYDSVVKYRETLTRPEFLGIIKGVKEFKYYE